MLPKLNLRDGLTAQTPERVALLAPACWAGVVRTLALPPQQARVLECLLRGEQDKQIAETLGLDISTVRTHFTRLFRRTGARDRVELVLCVFRVVLELRDPTMSSESMTAEPTTP